MPRHILIELDTIIVTPSTITTGGIAFLSAEILSIIVRESRFSGTPTYISLIQIGTTTSSPVGHAIQAPFSSMLCIYFPVCIFVYSIAGLYSVSN